VRRAPYALLALLLALVLAACGGEGGAGGPGPAEGGEGAELWVTRDLGRELVLEAEVPAGMTAIQALDREAEIETGYGGRFVDAVNGIEGSLERQQDWFFFVNGIEPDRGGAEVSLRPGDVVWWDLRDWSRRMAQLAVVGALPEPFLHGWNGKRRPADVRAPAGFAEEAEALLRTLGGPDGQGEPNVFVLEVVAGEDGATLRARRGSKNDSPVTFTLAGSEAAVRAAAASLAADPSVVARRYEARFDHSGRVVG
jgi:Domain of unknown function (DUF4430)